MVFSSALFLYLFLPAVLAVYYFSPRSFRNAWLFLTSLTFYWWGEPEYCWVILLSIAMNYCFGLWVHHAGRRSAAQSAVVLAVVGNLSLLASLKYANFITDNLNVVLQYFHFEGIPLGPVHLPIGISFFTFQALSYVIDVYRGAGAVQRDPFSFGLYVALFPQLIAGPIVRYKDIDDQIRQRRESLERFGFGASRFIIGLAKKVLIANTMAVIADGIFPLPAGELTTGLAWTAVVSYALQIYFDFSGYSDMAIGLGHMFGFDFLENFAYPYVAQSLTDFWRRWHISLSTWFRDYLYIPLGGNRKGPLRTTLNLLTVFFLCGLWHGASWTFILWGLYHGLFLGVERMGLARVLSWVWRPIRHFYTLAAVLGGWVLFRSESLAQAGHFFQALGGLGSPASSHLISDYLTPEATLWFVIALVGCQPVLPWLDHHWIGLRGRLAGLSAVLFSAGGRSVAAIFYLLILGLSVFRIASGSYSPFIYFRF